MSRIHDERAAGTDAQAQFRRVVQRKELPDDIPDIEVRGGRTQPLRLFEVLAEIKLAPSKSEARRLVQQGAVTVNRERAKDPAETFGGAGETLIQVGKRRFARCTFWMNDHLFSNLFVNFEKTF